MKKITRVLAGLLIFGMFFSCKHNTNQQEEQNNQEEQGKSDPVTPDPVQPKKIEVVTFNPAAGEVEAGTKITLSTITDGAVIYYEFVKADGATTLTKENFKIKKYAEPVEITEAGTLYAIAAESESSTNVSEISKAAYTIKAAAPSVPEDSISLWTAESTAKAWSVYNFADLEKLAEIVNGGKDLAGVTITQKEDIAINEAVLGDNFAEPAEAEAGVANADLKTFAGIGSKEKPFAGTYDGNGKKITGLYIYGEQQGLGFFGGLKAATVKNVIILDACVVNKNVQVKDDGSHDGSDDDRFGGLIGVTKEGECNIENCIYVGTVGSKVAKERGGSYEYIGGLLGRVESDATTNLKNCITLVNIYATADYGPLVKKVSGKVNFDNCYGISLDKELYTKADKKYVFEAEDKDDIIAAVKTSFDVDLTSYFTKAGLDIAPVPVEKAEFSVEAGEIEVGSTVKLTAAANTEIYYEIVKADSETTLTAENYEFATKYTDPIKITEDVTIYAIVVGRHKVSEIASAKYTAVQPTEPIPEDSIRNWTSDSAVKTWSVYNFADLKKLAEIVNDGNPLAGVTITQKNNITINESVLGENFKEPAEAEECKPNADLINFEGIGSRKIPFSGTYDGDKKVISGLYIYGNHQGLGFFGCIKNATVKNVIIVDSCVINNNESASGDGSDDDRFGGLIGITFDSSEESESNTNTVENCVFVGTVGSEVAKKRGGGYEYIAGILGRVEASSIANVTNCYSLVKLYSSSSAPLVQKVSGKLNCTDSYGVSLDKKVYTDEPKSKTATVKTLDAEDGISKATVIEAAKTASGLDLTDYFTKAGL